MWFLGTGSSKKKYHLQIVFQHGDWISTCDFKKFQNRILNTQKWSQTWILNTHMHTHKHNTVAKSSFLVLFFSYLLQNRDTSPGNCQYAMSEVKWQVSGVLPVCPTSHGSQWCFPDSDCRTEPLPSALTICFMMDLGFLSCWQKRWHMLSKDRSRWKKI